MAGTGLRRRGRPDRQPLQQRVVAIPQLGAAVDPLIEVRQLAQTDGRLDVGHVVLVAGPDDLVVAKAGVGEPLPGADAEAVQREPLDLLGDRLGVGHQRPALDRGDVLGHVERERGEVAERADPPPLPLGPDRVRRVLDHVQPVAIAQLGQPVHVDRPAGQVHGHDRPGARGDRGLGGIEVDVCRSPGRCRPGPAWRRRARPRWRRRRTSSPGPAPRRRRRCRARPSTGSAPPCRRTRSGCRARRRTRTASPRSD